jgi:hypothetical protein
MRSNHCASRLRPKEYLVNRQDVTEPGVPETIWPDENLLSVIEIPASGTQVGQRHNIRSCGSPVGKSRVHPGERVESKAQLAALPRARRFSFPARPPAPHGPGYALNGLST